MEAARASHRLSDVEWQLLKCVNHGLTQLTMEHGVTCECVLCEARWRTDTQDPECRIVEFDL